MVQPTDHRYGDHVAVKVLRQLEKAIEPPKPVRRKTARKKTPVRSKVASSAG